MKTTAVTLALAGLLAFSAAGCAITREQSTVGQYVDDATITTRVKAKFAEDSTVSAMAIGVETLKGTVQLSGFAKSTTERDRAESLARGTPGVSMVKNDIVVRP
ncbi:MAG TPA: BON domain-containing protein [Zoogloea sp.]|uniref:BON domain-containing protein n=1 Tax=Zoogloea sp. TaxID=49181 RepID=UPI002C58AEE4|nr:BON domain-containing protein [Zoogloea sp.]HMV18572.1 BON domain-containing protein [Rhodocyclaceae bacterium]HMV63729.1 BON domain-containing protein [Rhodocyclaceae bacterium]HMW52033.1 BON domain-containing protein [Rhodocyclaceae bacterium]HMY51016.1 BON domain-containing protein [Rhodocyclaceae bacterium]HMZ76727.1 BON domain-containing protein [Rhodocyclaceae bacterium]